MKHYESDCRDTYQTGSVQPPKSYHGIIAVLMILITLLISVVTVLSMMNIRLFQKLEEQTMQAVSFEPQDQIVQVDSAPVDKTVEDAPVWGISLQEISSLYRSYHELPQGLYISQVEPGSTGEQAGLCAGDILLSLNGTAVADANQFTTIANKLHLNLK